MKLFLASAFYKVTEKFSQLFPYPTGSKVAFISTAADVYEPPRPWLDADRATLIALGFQVIDYDIKNKNEAELLNDLQDMDIIFVSGGNTFYLLYYVRETGFDRVVRKLIDEGKLYIGSSAGSLIMCPTIEPVKLLDDPELAPKMDSFNGLGLIDIVLLPHYGSVKREEKFEKILQEWSKEVELLPITDEEVVVVLDGNEWSLEHI